MRVQKIEYIILTVEEQSVLDNLWQKLNNLETENAGISMACDKLQEAIADFLDYVSAEDIDVD